MNYYAKCFQIFLIITCLFCFAASNLYAETEADAAKEKVKAKLKKDKTGTNPVNFTHDFRIYNEYQWLNTPGESNQNVTTVEFRTPFSNGKWQLRMRGRFQSINIDANDDGIDEVNNSGLGDFDFRFLTIPYVNMKKKLAIAVGLETFLPSATEDSLGSGAFSFGPQVFVAFFKPFGLKRMLFAPGYQHQFSVDEEEGRSKVHKGVIDLYVVWQSQDRQFWALFDPQIILDYEEDQEFMIIDLEMGTMLHKLLGTKGQSAYLRPAIGVGSDRPTDGSIEVGYKVIW
jgi:hypothetical protein